MKKLLTLFTFILISSLVFAQQSHLKVHDKINQNNKGERKEYKPAPKANATIYNYAAKAEKEFIYIPADSPGQFDYNSNTYDELGWTTISVAETDVISGLSISYDWTTDDYAYEGSFHLQSPTGTSIIIADGEATGSYTKSISDFNGETMDGDWILWIEDTWGDGGHQATNIEFTLFPLLQYDFTLTIPDGEAIYAGESHDYLVTINNTGADNDNFTPSIDGTGLWAYELYHADGTTELTGALNINSGESADFIVRVTVDPAATWGLTDTENFTVSSAEGGKAIESFDITTTALIVSGIPFVENFDAVTAPDLPLGWETETNTVAWRTDDGFGNSAPNSILTFYDMTNPKDDWFFTPAINLETGITYALNFFVEAPGWGGTAEQMKVMYGNAPNAAAMTELIIDLDNMLYDSYTEQRVLVNVPADGVYYIGFHAYSPADLDYISVDDISLEEILDYDAAVVSIDMNSIYEPGQPIIPEATVANRGIEDLTFDVVMTINDGTSDVYTSTQTVDIIFGDPDLTVAFDEWVSVKGEYTVSVEAILATDENPADNSLVSEFLVADLIYGDNIFTGALSNGIISTNYGGITPGLVESADDFILGPGLWSLEYVYADGWVEAGVLDGFGVRIYEDNAGAPGVLIHEEIVPTTDPTMLKLAAPVILDGEATYWISVYGHYETATAPAEGRWNWYGYDASIANIAHLRDHPDLFGTGNTDWQPFTDLGITTMTDLEFGLLGAEIISEVPFTTAFHEETGWDNPGGAWGSYNEKTYEEGEWLFHSTASVRGLADESFDGSPYSFRDRGVFRATNAGSASNMIGFSFQVRDWMTGDGVDRNVNVSYDGGSTWEVAGTINKAYFDEYQIYKPFVYYFATPQDFAAGDLVVEIDGGDGSNDSRINIGQFKALDAEMAYIDPVYTTYDLYNNYDVETTITFGSATIVTSVEEGGTELAVDQFSVVGGVLIINADYFAGALENDEFIFTVNFDNGDYAFLTVEVTDLTPVVTWPTATNITYGQTLAESTLSGGSAHVPGDETTDIPGTFSFVDPAISPLAGIYTADVIFVPDAYESNNPVDGTVDVTVEKATATITITDTEYTYDGTDKAVTVTTDPAGLTYDIVYTLDGTPSTPNIAGTYDVEVVIDDANYEGTAVDVLLINKAPLSITANSFSKTEGVEYVFDGTEFSTTPADLFASDEVTSVTLTSAGAEAGAALGDYEIIISDAVGTGLDNYDILYVNGTLTVTDKITLTIDGLVADNKVYDGTNAATISDWGTLVGVIPGDDVALDNTDAVVTFNNSNVGNGKTVTVTGLDLTGADAVKYVINDQTTSADITAKDLSITAEDKSKVYGEADPEFTVIYDGFVAGQDETVLGGTLEFNREVGEDVGTYLIAPFGLTSTNYNINYIDGSLEITPAALSITAEDKEKVYGELDPELTVVFDGFVFDEDETALGGALIVERDPGEDVGTYVITASGLTSDNYDILYVEGALEITPAPLSITAEDKVKVYGELDPELTVVFDGFVFDEDETALGGALIVERDPGEDVGTYVITASGLTSDNYDILYVEGTLEITPKELVITGSFTVLNKYYDGTVDATMDVNSLELFETVDGDDVALDNIVLEFADPNVGENIVVSIISAELVGADIDNYTLSLDGAPESSADITATIVTIGGTFTVLDKYYDGTTEATISENNLELIGVINDEDVILVDVVAEFDSPEVGEDIVVFISSAGIDGVDAGNYTLDLTGAPTTTANIMAITYTVTFSVDGENGQLSADVDGDAIVSGDEVVEESDVLFTAVPDDNYKVAEWTVNDNVLDSYTDLTYLYENLDQNIVVTVSFEEVVGISEISSVDVSVFPNPARDMFTVESSEMISKIRLVNISGQVVNEINVDAMRTEINVSNLRTGIYFMQIHTNDGITTERVQITR